MKLAILLIPAAIFAAGQTAPAPSPKTVWNGVYTDAQASRGQIEYENSCNACHEGDGPEGDSSARFKGELFMERWRGYDVEAMYTFIRETMPRRKPKSLPDQAYRDIVARLLQLNNFPAGSQELSAEGMKGVQIERKEGPSPLPGGALVQFVGCLTKGDNGAWVITSASEPMRTLRANGSTASEMEAAQAKPVGNQTYRLQNLGFLGPDFRPEMHEGHKMQTKGKLIRQPNRDRVDITSMEMVSTTCAAQ